ncbi:hypothetical protein TNCV_270841 [Trichonephila clavipes]|nr:hypothetical protein TNCV_270841 [Trichonephila clavipes]
MENLTEHRMHSVYDRRQDCRNKTMIRKKTALIILGRTSLSNTEKNAVFTTERYSVFAEEAIQFTVNGRNILMERKKKEEKRVNPLIPRDERRHSLSPEK